RRASADLSPPHPCWASGYRGGSGGAGARAPGGGPRHRRRSRPHSPRRARGNGVPRRYRDHRRRPGSVPRPSLGHLGQPSCTALWQCRPRRSVQMLLPAFYVASLASQGGLSTFCSRGGYSAVGLMWRICWLILGAVTCSRYLSLCPAAEYHEGQAGVAQLAERLPSKQDVAGSNPVSRSHRCNKPRVTIPWLLVLKVSSVTLAQQFDANKVAALGCYKDRIVQTSGTATNVSQVLGSYFVALRPGGDYSGFTSMQCFVSGPDAVMSVVNGQPVTVRGRIDDQSLGIITL